MDLFNFSFENHADEDLRYSHSPASTPNLVEAPADRVQSMHLSTKDHVTQDESDPTMQTLDLLDDDDDDTSCSETETELEPEMGVQKKTKIVKGPAICQTPMESPNKPRSYLGGATPAAYVSQCFNDATVSKKSSSDVSPSSVYSHPSTLQKQQQTLYSLPQTKYEIVAHNHHPTHSLRSAAPIHAPSTLSQSFHPPASVEPTTTTTKIATVPETDSVHTRNSYRLTPALSRWPPRKESLPSMLISTQSFMRFSNEHAPSPPSQLQGLAKRRCSPPLLAPIDVKKSFEAGDCLTFGVNRRAVRDEEADGNGEKVVKLRVRRREGSLREVGRERSRIIIPVPGLHLEGTSHPSSKIGIFESGRGRGGGGTHHGKNFTTWDFDDKLFFEELHHEYARLVGPFRHFSARSLRTIRPSCSTETESDSFSEKEMMKGFARPGLGKGRYGWVQWIHRISSHPSSKKQHTNKEEEANTSPITPTKEPEDITLEFIQGWSPTCIVVILALLIVFSLSVAVLWILLGTRTESDGVRISLDGDGQPEAKWALPVDTVGYRHAGERVAGGMLVGIFALMVGCTGVGGWLVISWLVE